MNKIIQQDIAVDYTYPVVFTRGLFRPENRALVEVIAPAIADHPAPAMVVFIEQDVARVHPGLTGAVENYFRQNIPALRGPAPVLVAGGEAVKSNRAVIDTLINHMAENRLDRHSFVFAIGGGALQDAVGYAASLVHRGLRMIRVPTTVLSQNDGGVGVKTAINHAAGKNFLGTFAPPFAVLNDLDFLNTLDDEAWRAGIAEAFKVAMIKDAAFLQWLCTHAEKLSARDEVAMEYLVIRCAELHLRHIREGGDPFEMGTARPLDYGHWSAHQLESMTGYGVGHGAAVAIGIALDALYAVRAGLLSSSVADQLVCGLHKVGFDLWHVAMDATDELLAGLDRFREHLGGRLCITLPSGAGASVEVSAVDQAIMRDCLRDLAARSRLAPCT